MGTSATVQGLEGYRAKLRRLSEASVKHISAALEKNGDELSAMRRRLVNKDAGDLEASIGWEWATGKGRAGLKGDMRLAIKATAGSPSAYYASWQEFGPYGTPYFFPAYRALKKTMQSRLARAYGKAAREAAGGVR
ncbi:HK97 gp10 family phage protein [Oceanicaulis sp.]|uniref:HK97 gp10 family phage protein n=1 Tax=Oceanicaulis sp. TaxID=1924941 RepID=UPI003F728E21